MKKAIIIFVLFFAIGCVRSLQPIISYSSKTKTKVYNEKELQKWEFFDIENDSIPGISLLRTNTIIKNKKEKEVIIAILDTEIDTNHEAIKPFLWINKNEIPDNGKDDDKNGYVDDINGWNFLGGTNNISSLRNNYECTRIVNYFKIHPPQNKKDSTLLNTARTRQEVIEKEGSNELQVLEYYKSVFPNC